MSNKMTFYKIKINNKLKIIINKKITLQIHK